MNDEELPDWSLFGFLSNSGESITGLVSNTKGGDNKFVMGFIGIALALCFFPISLCWFILSNGFSVGTKTWVYFIGMIIFIIVVTIQTMIQ